MKTYDVAISFSAGFVLEIEAETEEQAKEQALEQVNSGPLPGDVLDDIELHAEIVR